MAAIRQITGDLTLDKVDKVLDDLQQVRQSCMKAVAMDCSYSNVPKSTECYRDVNLILWTLTVMSMHLQFQIGKKCMCIAVFLLLLVLVNQLWQFVMKMSFL